MFANKVTKKLVKELNASILKMWKEKPKPKPDVMKLYLEMKNKPEWKGKVWHPELACLK